MKHSVVMNNLVIRSDVSRLTILHGAAQFGVVFICTGMRLAGDDVSETEPCLFVCRLISN